MSKNDADIYMGDSEPKLVNSDFNIFFDIFDIQINERKRTRSF